MTGSIKGSLAEVPAPLGQRPQWIAEMHARAARRRRLTWAVGGLAFASATAAVLLAVLVPRERRETAPTATAPSRSAVTGHAPGETVTPAPTKTPAGFSAPGVVLDRAPVRVVPAIGGRLKANVAVDDVVKKGEVIAIIDDTELRAEVTRNATAVFDAKRQLKRMERLAEAQVVTQAELAKAKATLEAAEAKLRDAGNRLAETEVRSPIDGIVLDVSRGRDGITFEIGDLTPIVEVRLGDPNLKRVSIGQQVAITTESDTSHVTRGTVREIAEQAMLVRIEVDRTTAPETLEHGMSVVVQFDVAAPMKAPSDPSASVRRPPWITSDTPGAASCSDQGGRLECIGVSEYSADKEVAKQAAITLALDMMAKQIAREAAVSTPAARKAIDASLHIRPSSPPMPDDWYWEEYAKESGSGTEVLGFARMSLAADARKAITAALASAK